MSNYADDSVTSALSLMVLRSRYAANVFPDYTDGRPDPAIKDLNSFEYNYYGKVNQDGVPIVVKPESLVRISQGTEFIEPGQHKVLPVVKRIHEEMRNNIRIKVAVGSLLPTDRSVSTLEPFQSFVSAREMYKSYILRLLNNFNLYYINDNIKYNITSYTSYVKYLYEYFQTLGRTEPITFSGWITSDQNSIYTTGLALSIKDFEYDNDNTNVEFASNLMFPYYKKLAMNKGFSIVRQAPWILVADLNSPAIRSFTPYTSANQIINTFYEPAYVYDLQLLIETIINSYNNFVILNEDDAIRGVTCANKTYIHKFKREYVSPTSDYYNHKRYIKMYTKLRNQEEGAPLSPGLLKNTINIAKKRFDNGDGLGYIARIFGEELFNKPFGFRDSLRRQKKRAASQLGIVQSTEEATEQVQSSTGGMGGMTSGGGTSGGGSGGGY